LISPATNILFSTSLNTPLFCLLFLVFCIFLNVLYYFLWRHILVFLPRIYQFISAMFSLPTYHFFGVIYNFQAKDLLVSITRSLLTYFLIPSVHFYLNPQNIAYLILLSLVTQTQDFRTLLNLFSSSSQISEVMFFQSISSFSILTFTRIS
jgi:hypothetical protein